MVSQTTISLQTEDAASIETKRLHIVPTAMGLMSPPGFNNGVNGALAMNSPKAAGHCPSSIKFTTPVIEIRRSSETASAWPLMASKICYARSPSRPHEVPLGKLLMAFSTAFELTDTDAAVMGSDGNVGGRETGCLCCKSVKVASLGGAMPFEDRTRIAVV